MLFTLLLCGTVLSQEWYSVDVTGDYEIAISKDEDDGSGRQLRETTYDSIRIVVHYVNVNLSTEKDEYLKLSLMPSAIKFFGSIVKVQRRTTPIVVTGSTCI